MKAKLIKDEDGYSLSTREENSTNRKFIATTQGMYVEYKLSKQNCDEIFGVVDVKKMGWEYYQNNGLYFHSDIAFASGLNKAMELYQPTEIEVEIVMELEIDTSKLIGAIYGHKPKLDSEGCLILKKI